MKHLVRLVLLTMAASALSFTVHAQGQVAYTAKTVNVRAGPGRDYPVVVVVPAGYQVVVQGCLPNYTWCDVLAGPSRGWVWAGNINYSYQNTYVPVLNYGAVIGIAALAFVLDDYWGRHYHDRPWYGERQRWARRPQPRYNAPASPWPGVVGPRPLARPRDANPSGGVLLGPSAPPRQGTPRQRANPSGGVLPGPSAPPRQGTPRQRANPSGGVLPGPSAPPRQGTPREKGNPSGAVLPGRGAPERPSPRSEERDRRPDEQRR